MSAKRQSFKGGIGMAVAVVLAWGVGEAGVEMPSEVVAALGAIIGAVIASIKDHV